MESGLSSALHKGQFEDVWSARAISELFPSADKSGVISVLCSPTVDFSDEVISSGITGGDTTGDAELNSAGDPDAESFFFETAGGESGAESGSESGGDPGGDSASESMGESGGEPGGESGGEPGGELAFSSSSAFTDMRLVAELRSEDPNPNILPDTASGAGGFGTSVSPPKPNNFPVTDSEGCDAVPEGLLPPPNPPKSFPVTDSAV